jgi:transposase
VWGGVFAAGGVRAGRDPGQPSDQIKTDPRDALKLARLHAAGQLRAVVVPAPELEALRGLVRAREDLRGELMSARHRIGKLLLRRGVVRRGPGETWLTRHLRWPSTVRFDQPLVEVVFGEYLAHHEVLLARRDRLDGLIAEQAGQGSWAPMVARLRCLRGIDTLTAVGLVAEIADITASAHPKQLASYLGLVPSEQSSGTRRRQGSITKAGSGHARRLLIEAAWHYRRPPRVSLTLKRRQAGQLPAAIEAAWRAQLRLHRRCATSTRRAPRSAPPSRSPSPANWPALSGRSPCSPTDNHHHNPSGVGAAAGAASAGTRDAATSTDPGRRARS